MSKFLSNKFMSNKVVVLLGPIVVVALLVLVMTATAATGYEVTLIATACVNIVVLSGLNIIAGYGGQLALGQAAFTGIGAYATVITVVDLGVPTVIALILAPIISAAFAVVIGLPSLRLKGLYFAVATLAFGVILNQVLLQGGTVTGGPDGRGAGMIPLTLFGVMITDPVHKVILSATAALLALFIMRALMGTWFGWGLRAANVSEPAASGIGTPVFRTRLFAFVIAGALGGLGGSLLAFEQLYVSPTSFTFFASIDLFMVLYLGGLGTFIGPIVGAGILYIFSRFFSAFPDAQPFILGAIFLLALRFFPLGVGGYANTLIKRLNKKRAKEPDPINVLEEAEAELETTPANGATS